MKFLTRRFVSLASILALTVLPAATAYAEPAVTHVGLDHYRGTWLEIARRPMKITDGCVAGYTTYRPSSSARIIDVEDGCHDGTPDGPLRSIKAYGKIENFGDGNSKLTVRYPFFITFRYWVLYEAPDHSWFISADPEMENLWIYSRSVPSKQALAAMVRKAKALGYDTRKLEFPAQ